MGESYNGGDTNIAVQASGAGASINWTSVGLSKILTSGDGLPAAQADTGGAIAITGGAIETSGAAAPAILSKGGEGGSSVTVSGGTTILTEDAGSAGLAVSGLGASLTATGADPSTGVDVKTNGVRSIGATNGFGSGLEPGGTMNLTNTTIETLGEDAHAVAVGGPGSLTNLGVGNALTTVGNGAIGIFATDGAVVNGTGGEVTITTSGANSEATGLSAYGVNADGQDSRVSLAALTVTTAGVNAYGLFASNGGAINDPDAPSIATSGAGAIGVLASGAGSSVAVGGGASITTGGDSATGVQADSGGQVALSGGSVTTSGIGAPGLSVDGAGSKITASSVAVATNGGFDPSTGSFSFGVIASNGGSATVSGGSITTNGPVAHGVFAFNGGSVALSGGTTVLTTGGGSFGLFVNGAGSSLTATDVSVTTEGGVGPAFGDAAIGAYNGFASPGDPTGGAMTLTNTTITTSGAAAIGVETNSGGVTNISGGAVNTSGEGAHALFVTGAGSSVNLTGATTFATQGDGAIGLYALAGGVIDATGPVTITTGSTSAATGLNAYGVNADGPGSQVSLNAAAMITTNWTGAYGLYASDGGAIEAEDAPSIATHGAGAIGVYASGAGSSVALGGASITTTGTDSFGVQADTGGAVTLNGGSVAASGIGANGLWVGAGSTIAASNVVVTTRGGIDTSTGIYPVGALAWNGGSVTFSGGSITTSGASADAVASDGAGSSITLSGGTTILTTGNGSAGLVVVGSGASLTATDVSITTRGSTDSSDGFISYGAYNGGFSTFPTGGAMTLTDTTIATTGMAAIGVETNSGGVTNISGGEVNTSGQDAHALFVTGAGSTVNLSGATTFATQGNGSIGLYALSGGVIDALGQTTIATSGAVSAATGLNAYGVNADGAGSAVNLAATTITTTGAGAAGLYASDVTGSGHGGAIAVSGPLSIVTGGLSAYGAWAQGAGSTIALNGPTTIALSGDKSAGLVAAAGGAVSAQGSTSIAVSGAGSIGVQALSGMVTASGALNVLTSQATAAAFALGGASPSIVATGGGTVSAAGNAIAFTNATNAVATFDNFNFKSSGDLIFADPSSATINLNHTIANAGAGNLLNATAGSTVAFNASASTLTGAIVTDPTSLTNVSLANGTNWTLSASSTATSLNLANSAIVFAPSGGFKTLALGSYVGSGANITLNTALGGPNAGSTDQLVINGGSAVGSTSLTIKNASGAAGAATTGAGIPVVVATNGGTTGTNAFYLANGAPILAGGYEYTLGRSSNQDWYLTSSPAASMSQIQSSVTSLAQAQLKQLVTSRVLGSLLLGATEQVNGCSCGGGFASIGSFSLGSHGRWALNDSVTLLAGAAFESYYQDGANVKAAPIVAASLRYDPPNWGKSRPFFEVGAALSPYIDATYTRYYTNGLTPAQGVGSAVDRSVSVFGRIGWVDRLTPIDEAAVFADLIRGWQQSGGYTEAASAVNPFPATVSTGVDRQDVVRFGAQYTRLLFGNIEGNISGAIAYGFDNRFGSQVNVTSFGSVAPYPLLNSAWTEFGGRLAYRFSRNLVVDAFLIGTLGGDIGPTLHGGLGVRYAF